MKIPKRIRMKATAVAVRLLDTSEYIDKVILHLASYLVRADEETEMHLIKKIKTYVCVQRRINQTIHVIQREYQD